MNDSFLFLAINAVVFSILCIVYMCVWIHRDAKSRGQSGLAWVIITIASSPVVGLLAYLLEGRKVCRVPCQNCGWMISQDARFCERCGTEQSHAFLPPPEKKRNNRFLIASIVCFVGSILCILGMVFAAVIGGNIPSMSGYPSPSVNIMSTSTMWNGEWKVSCYYCSDGYLKKDFTVKDPSQESLYTNITCEEGQIFLHVQQADKKVQYDITSVQGEFTLPLSDFQPGKIRVMVEVRSIKNLKSVISIQ